MEFTGEQVVVGPGAAWFWDRLAVEHVCRYLFASGLVAGQRVLDAACGTGYGSAILARSALEVVGVDASTDAVRFAEEHWGADSVRFEEGDVTRLPFAEGVLDAVVSFETIEHVEAQRAFLAEVSRVLRPGGRFLVSTPDRAVYNWADHWDDGANPFHKLEMSRQQFEDALGEWFAVQALHGQILVGDYPGVGHDSVTNGQGRAGGRGRQFRRRVRSVAVAIARPWLRSQTLAYRLAPVIHRRFMPQPIDDRPWKYVIAVCEKRAGV